MGPELGRQDLGSDGNRWRSWGAECKARCSPEVTHPEDTAFRRLRGGTVLGEAGGKPDGHRFPEAKGNSFSEWKECKSCGL